MEEEGIISFGIWQEAFTDFISQILLSLSSFTGHQQEVHKGKWL